MEMGMEMDLFSFFGLYQGLKESEIKLVFT